MTIANKSETVKLTNELKVAQEEVQMLQQRIARMEMLFLQHASGLAPKETEIPSGIIRMLSGDELGLHTKELMDGSDDNSSLSNSDSGSAFHSCVIDDQEANAFVSDDDFANNVIMEHFASGKQIPMDEVKQIMDLVYGERDSETSDTKDTESKARLDRLNSVMRRKSATQSMMNELSGKFEKKRCWTTPLASYSDSGPSSEGLRAYAVSKQLEALRLSVQVLDIHQLEDLTR
jgi:hypothetical protein